MPSRSHPRLLASLATRIATVGRLRLVGPLVRRRHSAARGTRSNGAQRLKEVYAAFSADGLELQPTPLLLVDDRSDTGWTIAEATRVLRAAGAGPILPLVLAIEG